MTVEVRAFTGAQLASYVPMAEDSYVVDLVRAGALDEERARAKAELDYSDADQGATTFLAAYAVVDGQEEWVGVLGYGLQGFGSPHEEPTLFVHDLEVFEPFRRRGFAEALLAVAADLAREAGAQAVRLTVWGGNHAAHDLYAKVGFEPEQHRLRLRVAPA